MTAQVNFLSNFQIFFVVKFPGYSAGIIGNCSRGFITVRQISLNFNNTANKIITARFS